jgi:hypothetical protein
MSRKRTQRPHVARRAVWPRRLALLLFAFGLMMFGGWSLATKVSRAAGSPVEDSWRETPALNMVYYWQLYERRDGKYAEDWPENKLLAVDTFLFGYRQALLDMDITAHIANNHADRVWVELNNSSTNYPEQLAAKKIYDYPPHLNAHLPWRNP